MQMMPRFVKTFHTDQRGLSYFETGISLLSLIVLFVVAFIVLGRPESVLKGGAVAFIGVVVGFIAWSWKQTNASLQNRAQL